MNENESHKTLTTQSILWVQWEGMWRENSSVEAFSHVWPTFTDSEKFWQSFRFLFITFCLLVESFQVLSGFVRRYAERETILVFIRCTLRIWKDFPFGWNAFLVEVYTKLHWWNIKNSMNTRVPWGRRVLMEMIFDLRGASWDWQG